jgi:DNA-binding SARP family transcriptional activator/TolB-like protein
LLAVLATAGPTGFSRDKLLLHLWPESDEERARHALKQAVYSLRRELGTDEVIVGTASLSLNPSIITSDARDFETAIAAGDHTIAIALYNGPFLDGFHLKDSVEFERWSGEQRARYAHMWTTAVERLASDSEARSAWRDAAGHWRTLAAGEPLSGRLTGALIRCLAESGDLGAALSQYRIHESLLREELGSTPELEVAALAEAIRTGTWQRSPDKPLARPAATLPAAPSTSIAAPGSPPPFIPSHGGPPPAESHPEAHAGTPPARSRRRSTAVAFGLGMVVVLIAVLTVGYRRIDPETRAVLRTLMSRKPLRVESRQIVVAPFENQTGDTTLNALGEQTADWFSRELNDAGFVVVDSRTARIDSKVVERIPRLFRAHDLNIALAEENGSAFVVIGKYYKEGTRLEGNVSVIDVATKQTIKSLGPYYGTRDSADAFIKSLLVPTVAFLGQRVDTTAGGLTASYTSPPSLEAFERVSRAWERFFALPRDTASVFAELDSAARLDTSYATPLLMKAYILDVKSQWAGVRDIVHRVRPLAPKMSRLEKGALELFESDLRGDALGRIAISKRLEALSPGSAEMPLLVVVSSLYAGRPAAAVATLAQTDPDRGLNLAAPAYWEWSAEALHEAGNFAAEGDVAKTGLKRFRDQPPSTYNLVRVLATRNDKDLRETVDRGIPPARNLNDEPRDPVGDHLDLMILAGRELRTHGHAAAADSFFASAAKELATLPPNADMVQLRRQAHAFYEAKDYVRAKTAFAAILQRDSLDIESEGRLGTSAVHLGDSATARRVDSHLATMKRPFLMGGASRWRANIAAVQGRAPEACALLELAVRQGHRLMDTPLNLTVHLDGDFVAVRTHPAYAAMLQSLADTR